MNSIRSICVYCGSSPGRDPAHLEAARLLGTAMGEAGIRLVYGGGTKGIMGAVSDAVLAAGGSVTGIIPRFLIDMEATESELKRLDELVVTEDMHERKHKMFERSDAFVALPGGIGTLEELVEIMTWSQLGRHAKPIAIANIAGFWNPFASLLEHMRDEGFIHTAHQVKPLVIDRAEDIVPTLSRHAPAPEERVGEPALIDKL
ncbi:cytokinin riboside 5'-monophosphate phosphoribohydrolase [Aureimonas endophytica]|uniref:Cytokinin riboside 5'-monophosphate phosphoribohydrolase n=1 Tax=Aureimonas endophytica TaxID=2027858 RepID=A0A917EC56_9HYPH|nr:TIGR00730 family Rossman fold protein [Aureimonas endophytica]GGE18647.1 cytokinin riboside 5'-monophosphate phosphoribohydrolase [Aureimonas endophytica]